MGAQESALVIGPAQEEYVVAHRCDCLGAADVGCLAIGVQFGPCAAAVALRDCQAPQVPEHGPILRRAPEQKHAAVRSSRQ